MKLNVGERVILSGVMPQEGNFETMSTVDNLKSVIYMSEEEVEKFEVIEEQDRVLWNAEGDKSVDVEISDLGIKVLLKGFEGLDKAEKLTLYHYQLYKRFMEEMASRDKKREDKK